MRGIQSCLFETFHEDLLMNHKKTIDNYNKCMKTKPSRFKIGDKVKGRVQCEPD